MAGSIEIQKQHIKEFYQHKSENPELAGYDEKGNYVFYAKQKESDKGNPKQVIKTIPSIVYRKKTPEELQAEEQASAATIKETIELYTKKRMELFTESTKIGADNKVLHKLNMELAEIDKLLISVRYKHFHIQPYMRNQSNIKMRDIFFENAVEDRKVENDMSMIETRRDSIQREFVPVNDFVSLAEAKTMMSPLGEQVQEAVFNTLSAKPATAVKPVKGLSKIGSKSIKAAAPATTAAATTATAVATTATAAATTTVEPTKGVPKIGSSAVPKRISLTPITKSFVGEPAAAAGKGKVYIGTSARGSAWSTKPYEGIKTVNVTSAQGKDSPYRRDFSPMTPIAGGYKGFWNFESYWQSGKVFEGIPKDVARKWWREQRVPKRKYAGPGSKGKPLKVLYSAWPDHTDNTGKEIQMQWIQSRKEVYVPEYNTLVNSRASTKELQAFVNSGKDIMIYDLDGPKEPDGKPATLEVTLDVLRQKINATDFPFGHGYIVAAMILGIPAEQYTMPTQQDKLNVEIPEDEEVVEVPSAAAAAEP